ncbi:unnamed protein product [Closterium sp. NIES-54]
MHAPLPPLFPTPQYLRAFLWPVTHPLPLPPLVASPPSLTSHPPPFPHAAQSSGGESVARGQRLSRAQQQPAPSTAAPPGDGRAPPHATATTRCCCLWPTEFSWREQWRRRE